MLIVLFLVFIPFLTNNRLCIENSKFFELVKKLHVWDCCHLTLCFIDFDVWWYNVSEFWYWTQFWQSCFKIHHYVFCQCKLWHIPTNMLVLLWMDPYVRVCFLWMLWINWKPIINWLDYKNRLFIYIYLSPLT